MKARINGGLEYTDEFGNKVSSEGNYRIEVRAEPGQAQVQKSNIIHYCETVSYETKTISVPDTTTIQKPIDSEYIINLETMLDNSMTPASSGIGWSFGTDSNGNNCLKISESGKFNITGTAPAGMYINVESTASDAVVFMSDVSIDNSNYDLPAFQIAVGAKVDMYLSVDNILTGGGNYAGLVVPDGAELTISSFSGDGSTEGTLTATGGAEGGAGIGGSNSTVSNVRIGTITINGGTINATGGILGGAGIGEGDNDYLWSVVNGGGKITINGGDITARGGGDGYSTLYSVGAGIGTSTYLDVEANDTIITITGGKVRAYLR